MSIRTVAFAVMLFVASMFAPAASAGGHGSVYATTLPPGATVWLDGNYMGETPLFMDGLDGGRHSVTLTRSGWQPQSSAVEVTVGHVATVSAVLTANAPAPQSSARPKGTLSVRGAGGAKVFVDGVPLPTPYESQQVASGDHILLVQRARDRITSSIRIYPQTTTTVSLAARVAATTTDEGEDMLAALQAYVPDSDFTVNGDEITIHHKGIELECAVGSRNYVLNGRPGTLSVAPAMIGNKPYLPLSLLTRITSQTKSATH
ncbi:MAG: PEGA domain-containing protein [Candidatus Eremiobacteraeota bacterium]|nr:PEGA domain-containing protein [Candidatus Eremiobacteraeota bacterium]